MPNHPSPEWVRASEIVRDAGGRIVGRTRLQKVAYLLEVVGLGGGFQFEYRHYGPFSEGLADAIQMAEAFDLVKQEEKRADWGGMYSIYTAELDKGETNPRATFAQKAAKIGAVELELAATAAFLKVTGSGMPWEETKRLKPEKATAQRLQKAKEAYRDLQKIKVPKPLPPL
jgi:uncharacterized protein YwgA